jgi:hypothetical protein
MLQGSVKSTYVRVRWQCRYSLLDTVCMYRYFVHVRLTGSTGSGANRLFRTYPAPFLKLYLGRYVSRTAGVSAGHILSDGDFGELGHCRGFVSFTLSTLYHLLG